MTATKIVGDLEVTGAVTATGGVNMPTAGSFTNLAATGTVTLEGASMPLNVAYTIGTEAANAITVNVQVNDGAGAAMATASAFNMWLASDSAGLNPDATEPDTSVAAGTDGAIVKLGTGVYFVTTEADGDLDIVITHAGGADTWYMAILLPNGKLAVSSAITFAA